MAKKKMNIVEEKQNSPQTITYGANVTLKLMKGKTTIESRVIKNNGTLRLFRGIALALTSAEILNLNLYLPKYLGIGYVSKHLDATTAHQKYLQCESSDDLEIDGRIVRVRVNPQNVDETDTSCIAPFTVTIPSSTVIAADSEGRINELGLFSTPDTGTLLARIILTENPIKVDPGMTLIIEWKINIENKTIA